MKAAWKGFTEIVVELVKTKANLNLQNKVQYLLHTFIYSTYVHEQNHTTCNNYMPILSHMVFNFSSFHHSIFICRDGASH